jgi:hypothetical protein
MKAKIISQIEHTENLVRNGRTDLWALTTEAGKTLVTGGVAKLRAYMAGVASDTPMLYVYYMGN